MKKQYGLLAVVLFASGLYAVILKNDFVTKATPAELRKFVDQSRPDVKFDTKATGDATLKKLGFKSDKEWLAYLKAKPETTTTEVAPVVPLEIKKMAKKSKYGATEAHLSILQNRTELSKRYGFTLDTNTPVGTIPLKLYRSTDKGPSPTKLAQYEALLNSVVKRENKYKDTHYVFYHALSKAWIVPQDLYFKLYSYLRPLSADIKNFRFLRWNGDAQSNIIDFIMKEMETIGLVNDNLDNVKFALLSVNLALFGNVGFDGECTWQYFRKPKSHASVSAGIFESILGQFAVENKENYVERLMKLDEQYLSPEKLKSGAAPQEQVLLQIFIPKLEVDAIGYIAWIKGVPNQQELIAWVENKAKSDVAKSPKFEHADAVFKEITDLFKEEKEKNPLYKTIVDGIRKGNYSLAKVLDVYTNTPELIPNINHLQARLFATGSLWYPKQDVRMYDYNLIPKDRLKAYHEALDAIVGEIVQDVLAKAKK